MSNLILTKADEPFKTMKAAQMAAGRYEQDMEVVEVEGGFALKPTGDAKRPRRVPLGTRNVLKVREKDRDPNYKYRFVNDVEDRIETFKDAGWEVVRKDIKVSDEDAASPSKLGSAVTKMVGGGTLTYLMRKRKDWFEEDYAAKQRVVQRSEDAMRLNRKAQDAAEDGVYGKVAFGE